MVVRDLLPVRRAGRSVPVRRGDGNVLDRLWENMDRMFDHLWGDWDVGLFGRVPLPRGAFSPRVDVSESTSDIEVSVELPGMDEDDIELTLSDDVLTIEGEKREEHEERGQEAYCRERRYGRFRREVPLPEGADSERAEALFENGVLAVRLPKRHAEQQTRRRIPIKTPS